MILPSASASARGIFYPGFTAIAAQSTAAPVVVDHRGAQSASSGTTSGRTRKGTLDRRKLGLREGLVAFPELPPHAGNQRRRHGWRLVAP